MSFKIERNDITKVHTDAIVNTANPLPRIGRGTDTAVYNAAGREELLKAREEIGVIEPGHSVSTKSFNLKKNGIKYIIHTVGCRYDADKPETVQNLRNCYSSSLKIAKDLGCKSVAIPLLATGFYGFPKELGLKIAVDEISSFLLENEIDVTLVVYDAKSYMISEKLFDDIQNFLDENLKGEEDGVFGSFDEVSSSSEAAPESSSEAESSSSVNSEYPYTLSTFPNVHCKDSSYFHKSWCPSSKPTLKQSIAEMETDMPLYGVVQPVCQDYDRTEHVYTCDNGCKYQPGAFNLLQGDTIFQQEYSNIDKKYIPIQKKIAQDSAQAEASTSYPYMLASDTTVHCKTMYKTKIAKSTPSSLCETYSEGYYLKCKDGNNYEWEEMFRGENGLIERENPDE